MLRLVNQCRRILSALLLVGFLRLTISGQAGRGRVA
jgi:hypothetical protein